MDRCVQCGNHYDKSFEVRMGGPHHDLRLIRMRDPGARASVPNCGNRMIGHGVQHGCVHCAKHEGVKGLRDRD